MTYMTQWNGDRRFTIGCWLTLDGMLSLLVALFPLLATGPLPPVPVDGLSRTLPATATSALEGLEPTDCDSSCLEEGVSRLERLGVFAEVRAGRDSSGAARWRVRELPWLLPVPNGRLSDEEGLSLGAGVRTPNLVGRAIAGEFLFLAGNSFEVQGSLASDRWGSLPLSWEAYAGRTDRWDEARDYREVSHRGRLELSWPADRPLRVLARGDLVHVDADRSGIALEADGTDWLPSATGGLAWDSRDRRGLTTAGWKGELSWEKVGGLLGGPADGWCTVVDLRGWIPLGGPFGLHLSQLLEDQRGRTGGWRTFVLGGANTARGVAAGRLVARSEQIATAELRWLVLPVRSFRVVGQELYGGLQLVAGLDGAAAWNESWGERRALGASLGADLVVPFVERIRLSVATGTLGPRVQLLAGLFEKSTAERFRVR